MATDDFAWDGGTRPRAPTEGFATDLSVGVGASAVASSPASGPPPRSVIEDGDGLNVKVGRVVKKSGPEVVRRSGRVRLKPT